MGFFNNLILTIITMGALFLLYKTIKYQPQLFSKNNLNKSFTTMGILALILIAIIGMIIMLLKN